MLRFDDDAAGGPTAMTLRHPLRRLLPVVQAVALTATAIVAVWLASASASALDDAPWQIPERPPRCTTAEANSGDVAGCLLTAYRDPSTTGWGVAPAPGVGEGWSWLGYTYNGSPALAEWEVTEIVENTEPVAGFRPGYLETHRFAQPLFEGFLDEISANGYRVRGVSGYSFRCTSGKRRLVVPVGRPRRPLEPRLGPRHRHERRHQPDPQLRGRRRRHRVPDADADRHAGMGHPDGRALGSVLGRLRLEQRLPVGRHPTNQGLPRSAPLRVPRYARTGASNRRLQPGERPAAPMLGRRRRCGTDHRTVQPHGDPRGAAGGWRSRSRLLPEPAPHSST